MLDLTLSSQRVRKNAIYPCSNLFRLVNGIFKAPGLEKKTFTNKQGDFDKEFSTKSEQVNL